MPPRQGASAEQVADSFSAPKGVERACPDYTTIDALTVPEFQCPEGR